MFDDIKVVWRPKKLTLEYPDTPALQQIGREGFRMVRDRITNTQTLADGSKLPELRFFQSGRGFIVSNNDPRFQPATARDSGGQVRPTHRQPANGGGIMVTKGEPEATLYTRGYPAAKQRLGARPIRDGLLTGDMWNSGRATLTKTTNGVRITVGFRGLDRTGMRNHDKAFYFQKVDSKGRRTKLPMFRLMAWTDEEFAVLVTMATKNTSLFLDR